MNQSTTEDDVSPLPFLHLMQTLKHLPRTGWLRTVEQPESVASHSFRLALLGGFAPKPLNRTKCILIGLCHDLAESVVGDIPSYAGVPKERKHRLEELGFRYIVSLVEPCNKHFATDIMAAWHEYEHGSSQEARWMREMDKLECLVQAHEYEQMTYGEKDLSEFQGLTSKISSPEGLKWLGALQMERNAHFSKRKQRLPVIFIAGDINGGEANYASLSQRFDFQEICVADLLIEKSKDQEYHHAELLGDYLKEGADVPVGLLVDLIEMQLEEHKKNTKKWTFVQGFPTNKQQLLEFERKVQIPIYLILLSRSVPDNSSPAEHLSRSHRSSWEQGLRASQNADLIEYLRDTDGYYKEIKYIGDIAKSFGLVEAAVEGFLEHGMVYQ